jgi:SAM-dependent methyltransferase
MSERAAPIPSTDRELVVRSLKSLIHRAGQVYVSRICLDEFNNQRFTGHNERSIEYGFALRALAEERPKTVLDVGTGTTAWPHLLNNCGYVVTAIDNVRDYWPRGMSNRHWAVRDVDIVDPGQQLGKFDAVTCISVLEHIEDHERAMRSMASLLAPDGILILTTPYSHDHPCPNVYKRPDALYGKELPYICRSSSSADVDRWRGMNLALQHQELWRLFTGDVWATGERCDWTQALTPGEPHQLGCFVFRKK